MKYLRFAHEGRTLLGAVVAEGEVAILGEGDSVLAIIGADPSAAPRVALDAVRLLAPIARPPKFLAAGLNYLDHIIECGLERPSSLVAFNKQSTCVIGPFDAVHAPRASTMLDYEGELGVVIGRRCRHVPADRAHEVVAGYVVVNDVSARDWQARTPTITLGKSFDTHGPTGPWLVTPDEVGDPHQLGIRTWVNTELVQDGNTADMVFNIWSQIETLSTVCTLEPGDIIATGTPAGVGLARNPPRFLKPGDVVRVEIDRIGAIQNPVIAEPADTAFGF